MRIHSLEITRQSGPKDPATDYAPDQNHTIIHFTAEEISELACDHLDQSTGTISQRAGNHRRYHVPAEVSQNPDLDRKYRGVCNQLLTACNGMISKHMARMQEAQPREEDETQENHRLRVQRTTASALKGLLPAATLVSTRISASAPDLERAVSRLMSHPLIEVQTLGNAIRQELPPSIAGNAGYSEWLAKPAPVSDIPLDEERFEPEPPAGPRADLIRFEPFAVSDLAVSLLYRDGREDHIHAWVRIKDAGTREAARIILETVRDIGPEDWLPLEFGIAQYTYELKLDYSALQDLRQRSSMTIIPQPLTTALGANTPGLVQELGLEPEFVEGIEEAGILYEAMQREHGRQVAQYAVTHAHLQRALTSVSIRELHRMKADDPDYGQVQELLNAMVKEALRVHPELRPLWETAPHGN